MFSHKTARKKEKKAANVNKAESSAGYSKSILLAIKGLSPDDNKQQEQQTLLMNKQSKQASPCSSTNYKESDINRNGQSPPDRRRSVSFDRASTAPKRLIDPIVQNRLGQKACSLSTVNTFSSSSGTLLASLPLGSSLATSCASSVHQESESRDRSQSLASSIGSFPKETIVANNVPFSKYSEALSACANGQLRAIEKFIREEPNLINYAYPHCYRLTCLHVAAKAGDKDIVCFLAKNGANLNAKDETWLTPLHMAAQAGHLEMVDLLRSFGANPTLQDAYGLVYSDYLCAKNDYVDNTDVPSKNEAPRNISTLTLPASFHRMGSFRKPFHRFRDLTFRF